LYLFQLIYTFFFSIFENISTIFSFFSIPTDSVFLFSELFVVTTSLFKFVESVEVIAVVGVVQDQPPPHQVLLFTTGAV